MTTSPQSRESPDTAKRIAVAEACACALDAKTQTNRKACANIKKRRPMIPPRDILSRGSPRRQQRSPRVSRPAEIFALRNSLSVCGALRFNRALAISREQSSRRTEMQIAPFEMERWQSVWENRVDLNVSESGVEPMTLRELLGETADIEKILNQRLGYPQTNGSEDLRAKIAALYPGARAENVLLTAGCAEANFLVTWLLIEPGDEIVFMMPNYMQVHGLAKGFGATVKPFWLRENLGWAPDLAELSQLVTNKT